MFNSKRKRTLSYELPEPRFGIADYVTVPDRPGELGVITEMYAPVVVEIENNGEEVVHFDGWRYEVTAYYMHWSGRYAEIDLRPAPRPAD